MSDFKSKLPDFKEFTSMANKLFKDIKTSVSEIIVDYKKKREGTANAEVKAKKEKVAANTEKAQKPKTKKTEDSKHDKD